jgi:hypothetical protein
MRIVVLLTSLLLVAGAAGAQVLNGDFEAGATGWTSTAGPGCPVIDPTGGNPGGCGVVPALSTTTQCGGSLSQTFNCGAPGGDCEISFDYRVDFLGGIGATVFGLTADGGVTWPFQTSGATAGWQSASLVLPCGPQTITFGVVVATATMQDWEFRVDNVTAACVDPVSAETPAWGALKAQYR